MRSRPDATANPGSSRRLRRPRRPPRSKAIRRCSRSTKPPHRQRLPRQPHPLRHRPSSLPRANGCRRWKRCCSRTCSPRRCSSRRRALSTRRWRWTSSCFAQPEGLLQDESAAAVFEGAAAPAQEDPPAEPPPFVSSPAFETGQSFHIPPTFPGYGTDQTAPIEQLPADALPPGFDSPPVHDVAVSFEPAPGYDTLPSVDPLPSAESTPPFAPVTSFEPAGAAPPTEPPVPPPPASQDDSQGDEDATLRDIYMRETALHVGSVRRWLARERPLPPPHRITEEVYRACHTLSGSSQMAAARHGIRIAEPLNDWLRRSFDSGEGLIDSDLDVLGDCMSALEDVSQHLTEATGFFVLHHDLPTRIAQADAALQRRIAAAEVAEKRLNESGLFQALDASALHDFEPEPAYEPRRAPPPPFNAPEAFRAPEPARPPAVEPPSAPSAAAPAMRASEPSAEVTAAPAIDYDPDIASIFSDEATELIDAAETALLAFGADGGNRDALDALKRPLHTLKGGARMAGVTAMGDVAHELESFVLQMEIGAIPSDARAQATAQAAIDELARMRELLASGRPVLPATELIARIQGREGPSAFEETMPAIEPSFAPPPAQAESAPYVPAESYAPAEPYPAAEEPPLEQELAPPQPAYEPAPQGGDAFTPAEHDEPQAASLPATQHPAAAAALVPPGREPTVPADRQEMARVDAELLNTLLNNAGEVSIGRSRVEQQLGSIEFNLGELSRTVIRLKEQLRKLEIETEKQILHRHESEAAHRGDFDPLELDRYSTIQQFSRALAETANDVASIQQLLETLTQETQNHLQQQARTITELQNGLMRTRMVSFQRHVQRLSRIVRQAATDTGKSAELVVEGATGELDRQVLERMLPPFEHMLRNAVVHGIESREQRRVSGKPETGQIKLVLRREGSEVIVDIGDDGGGMNLFAVRAKGIELGLIGPQQQLSDEDAMQLILEPASPPPAVSRSRRPWRRHGRGGHRDQEARRRAAHGDAQGAGHAFHHPPAVHAGGEPRAGGAHRRGVLRAAAAHGRRRGATLAQRGFRSPVERFAFVQLQRPEVPLQPLGVFVGLEPAPLPEQDVTLPIVLVRAGEHSTGLVVDELIGSREIVVKPVGPQIAGIRGISGATILGDGRIVVILDIVRWCARNGVRATCRSFRATRPTAAPSCWWSTTPSPCAA